MAYGFYIASVCGALAVWLLLPAGRKRPVMLGAILGAAALGGLLMLAGRWAQEAGQALPPVYYYIFSVLAVLSAVRVITHPRPVYSALYFVLVVLSVAGMFLILEAEFMAFAMVIIYAGAILVTYMFVIMLATLPPSAYEAGAPQYDRVAREPLLACLIGFALLGVLATVIFTPGQSIARQPGPDALTVATEQMPGRLTEGRLDPLMRNAGLIEAGEKIVRVEAETGQVVVGSADDAEGEERTVAVTGAVAEKLIGNIDRVGLNLFETHTLGIELAGVILLLSMVGAIVIARRKVAEEPAR
jgi:NADH-quinone oxidoreductase subunit J